MKRVQLFCAINLLVLSCTSFGKQWQTVNIDQIGVVSEAGQKVLVLVASDSKKLDKQTFIIKPTISQSALDIGIDAIIANKKLTILSNIDEIDQQSIPVVERLFGSEEYIDQP